MHFPCDLTMDFYRKIRSISRRFFMPTIWIFTHGKKPPVILVDASWDHQWPSETNHHNISKKGHFMGIKGTDIPVLILGSSQFSKCCSKDNWSYIHGWNTLTSQIIVARLLIFSAFCIWFLPIFGHKNACKILICEQIFKIQTAIESWEWDRHK